MRLFLEAPPEVIVADALRWAEGAIPGPFDSRCFVLWPRLVRILAPPEVPGARQLLCVAAMPGRLYPHQQRAVERAIFEQNGRALLADEVGLGKTIEAGAILRELQLRGRVRRALVLVPAGLVDQWRRELRRHCDVAVCVHPRADHGWDRDEVVLASLDAARHPLHRDAVLAHPWDLVVVDEAHRLKDHTSASYQLVASLHKSYLLLLTATPVHNELRELYNLVSLLRPGQLGTYRAFCREFSDGPRRVRNGQALRERLGNVLIRTRRHEAGVWLPPRRVTTHDLAFAPEEWALYQELLESLREPGGPFGTRSGQLLGAVLLREATSAWPAVAATLQRLAAGAAHRGQSGAVRLAQLAERAREVARHRLGPKLRWLAGYLRRQAPRWEAGRVGGQVVAFTQFATTARLAARVAARVGVPCNLFYGAMNPRQRRQALRRFQTSVALLVSTDAGSEGHNLHWAHEVVNLDLPWNPMRLEQRIGRVHRLGQQHPVQVHNLAVPGTIEGYLLALLFEKLGLFREVVGDLDEVVASVPGGFEARIREVVFTSRSDTEMRARLESLGQALHQRYRQWQQARSLTALTLDPESGPARVHGATAGHPERSVSW